ncbi:hypothetical protein GCM10011583_38660 [Streptomyces camponoticapitis]|uniref:Uncharacterized protein n=1 Tax=Streptomyces camponoticapitis TaxID=1616125 RepID=A0ABQ2EAT9_9ACTN|nr:hypothetical protein GCM10011583_38660 [Streptomyces camponoticapitis]
MTTGTAGRGAPRPSVLRRYVARLLLLLLLGRLLLLRRPALLLRRLLLRGPAGPALRLRLRGRVLRLRVLRLRRLGRCRAVETQPRSVGRIAEMHGGTGTDFQLVDPLALHISAVGAAVVLNYPTTAPPADGGVTPRDTRVVDHQVALRITPQAVRPGLVERPGPSVQFKYEFRHSMPHLLSPGLPPSQGV